MIRRLEDHKRRGFFVVVVACMTVFLYDICNLPCKINQRELET